MAASAAAGSAPAAAGTLETSSCNARATVSGRSHALKCPQSSISVITTVVFTMRSARGLITAGALDGSSSPQITAAGAEVLCNTPVVQLITEGEKVVGAIVKGENGYVKYLTAKGVVLATGGYEGDMDMYRQFNGGDRIYNAGSPYVTGDGVKMEMALGAQLWHMDGQTMSCGYFHGIKVPDFETTFVVFAHCEGSATATTTEVIRAVGCHFHHVCCCGIDHETNFIEKSPVSNQVARVMDGDDFAIQRFVEFYSSTSDIFPDEFHYRESVKIILRFEIIGAFPAHGS